MTSSRRWLDDRVFRFHEACKQKRAHRVVPLNERDQLWQYSRTLLLEFRLNQVADCQVAPKYCELLEREHHPDTQ